MITNNKRPMAIIALNVLRPANPLTPFAYAAAAHGAYTQRHRRRQLTMRENPSAASQTRARFYYPLVFHSPQLAEIFTGLSWRKT